MMNPVVLFLQTLGQALAAQGLYAEGHPMRAAARDRAHVALMRILENRGEVRVSLLDGAVVVGSRVLPELRGWEWGNKLAACGVQRFEIDAVPTPSTEELEAFVVELHQRLVAGPQGYMGPALPGFRLGALGVAGAAAPGDDAGEDGGANLPDPVDALVDVIAHIPLTAEAAAIRWIHEQVANGADVPLAEAAVVVNALALAMHQEQRMVLPLIDISAHEQYGTAHASNVATLAIALSEQMGLSPSDARAIGMAGLVHDIGNVSVPSALLIKPARLTEAERALVEAHTVEGARILSLRGRGNALAATVAYEHHRWDNGVGGYPNFQWPRRCHFASRLVRVCDIYDAMRSPRPYRRALSQADTLQHLQERSGTEVQGEIVQALVELLAHTPEARTVMEETTAREVESA